MTSSPVIVLALAGKDAIAISRKMMGATFGSKAEPGTIRGDFGVSNSFNLIHGSDSPEAAEHRTSSDPTKSVGRWRTDLSPSLRDVCAKSFHEVLGEFGYATDGQFEGA